MPETEGERTRYESTLGGAQLRKVTALHPALLVVLILTVFQIFRSEMANGSLSKF